MEYENHYASKGLAGTALGFGIGGAALGLLNGNGFNLFGNKTQCSEDHNINRYEATRRQELLSLKPK